MREVRLKKMGGYSMELNRLVFWCLAKEAQGRPKLGEILDAPEINLRIRERRYQEKLG